MPQLNIAKNVSTAEARDAIVTGGEEEVLAAFLAHPKALGDGAPNPFQRRAALGDAQSSAAFGEAALLGLVDDESAKPVYLNTHEPFCLVTVGVQGGGKSHTLGCVLESCLIPAGRLVRLESPHAALVLHYDNSASSVCEAAGLISPNQYGFSLPKGRMTVLVSPANYRQRRDFYGPDFNVRPLLFKWSSLSANHLKRIMRIRDGDSQLYVAVLLDLLRRYQRRDKFPVYQDFVDEVIEACNAKGQDGPLRQRLSLLNSVIAESTDNAELAGVAADLSDVCAPGNLVVVDLSDPLLAKDEANGIFAVLTEQFRIMDIQRCGGKLLVLDEAHKFMDGDDGLSDAIVAVARLMRHDGMRLAVSTQSPKALAPELLELLTVAVLHRFHSKDWLAYLQQKLPLDRDNVWRRLVELQPGHALVFASQLAISHPSVQEGECGRNVFPLRVRDRLTSDWGKTVTNVASKTQHK